MSDQEPKHHLAAEELVVSPPQIGKPELKVHATRRIRIPDIVWQEIPGGPFRYQDNEIRNLPTFWIARYPISNIQYQCFIDDGGYGTERWWAGLERPMPSEPRWGQSNRPRTEVNWFEAVAFSRWLAHRLGLAGEQLRLPTEIEWEKAARGTEGREYPWGDGYRSGFANLNETGGGIGERYLGQPTAVGLYPHGQSSFGVEDMAGTVWEWCLNKWDSREATAVDPSGDGRVVRGGSWIVDPPRARAAVRLRHHPGLRFDGGGFRVVRGAPV